MERLSHTESLYSIKERTYEICIFFQRSSAYPEFKSSHKIESCPCFITNAIDMFYPRLVIGENKHKCLWFVVSFIIVQCMKREG